MASGHSKIVGHGVARMTEDQQSYLKFPDQLDHADVIEFSDAGEFGTIQGDDQEIEHFAICQYEGDRGYYLFYCAGRGAGFDVITDSLEKSIEECKRIAAQHGEVVWHKK